MGHHSLEYLKLIPFGTMFYTLSGSPGAKAEVGKGSIAMGAPD